jgi:GMP synthase-like glutamine amidotransferase
VIQHQESAPGGYVHDWLRRRGADQDVYRIDLDRRELRASDYGLVVSLGSELAASDDSIPWLAHEQELLRDATEAGVPVLGICFGAQLLARALGGEAFRAQAPEIGWRQIRSRDRALISEGPWMQWHYDTFTTPPGGQLLAENSAGPQAFVLERSLGVQFHPEVTPEIVRGWASEGRQELEEQGIDSDRLLTESVEQADQAGDAALRLFERFLERASPARLQ